MASWRVKRGFVPSPCHTFLNAARDEVSYFERIYVDAERYCGNECFALDAMPSLVYPGHRLAPSPFSVPEPENVMSGDVSISGKDNSPCTDQPSGSLPTHPRRNNTPVRYLSTSLLLRYAEQGEDLREHLFGAGRALRREEDPHHHFPL